MSKINASSYFNTPNALGGYTISQSLRFGAATGGGYLSKTFGQNGTDWTWSAWIKRSSLGVHSALFVSSSTSNPYYQAGLFFNSSDELEYYQFSNASSKNSQAKSTAKFRDVSAWYHVVAQYDEGGNTTLYVNGEQVAQASNGSTHRFINKTTYPHYIGNYTYQSNPGGNFHGYMAEMHFVDGSLLEPEDFAVSENGIWLPKFYEGSHGTNGFYLPFDDSSDIGADSSGNDNDFTATTLVASDVVLDSPTNNFAVMNVLDKGSDFSTSEGNLKAATGGSSVGKMRATMGMSSGKWYWEVLIDFTGTAHGIGISTNSSSLSTYLGADSGDYAYWRTGLKANNASSASYGDSFADGDILSVAYDADAGTLEFYKNGVSQGDAYTGLSGTFFPSLGDIAGTDDVQYIVNFGQDDSFAGTVTPGGYADGNGRGSFKYPVPSGFLSLCTANLPDPAIDPASGDLPEDYFDIQLWTGTGSGQSFSNWSFQPDWLWFKQRSGGSDHALFDSIRGVNAGLVSNNSNAENNVANSSQDLVSFDSDGFTTGTPSQFGSLGASGSTIVTWGWAAGGTAVSNTDGATTSSVSANTKAGFSIVTYTGSDASGSGATTVGHGLDSAPELIITKNRDNTSDWRIYSDVTGNANALLLNTTTASGNTSSWNSTSPTSTVFSSNIYDGDEIVAYCFHSVEGYSKIGSYTGNGSSDGPFVHCGFRPALVMVKGSTISSNWFITDSKRDTYNVTTNKLTADTSSAESSNSGLAQFDMLSNGFKHRQGSGTGANNSGETYIFIAFAEMPFKYANAR